MKRRGRGVGGREKSKSYQLVSLKFVPFCLYLFFLLLFLCTNVLKQQIVAGKEEGEDEMEV